MATNPKAHFEFFCEKITVGELKPNILIIKLGAMGDVVRTTPLLHVLEGNVYWVTHEGSVPLLPQSHISYISPIEKAYYLKDVYFDTVICLDDEIEAAKLATSVKRRVLIGSYLNDKEQVKYTESSAEWFDLGLISRFGKEEADTLKRKNTKTYQEMLFNMIGRKFNAEEYLINIKEVKYTTRNKECLIGIERRAGNRWPMKAWNKYEELSESLEAEGYQTRFLEQREQLFSYIQDINDCDIIVSGDTLTLHLALALKKPNIAIFTCTSPVEIYGYERMVKIVSPLLEKYFYKRDYCLEPINAISLETVYDSVKSLVRTNTLANKIHC